MALPVPVSEQLANIPLSTNLLASTDQLVHRLLTESFTSSGEVYNPGTLDYATWWAQHLRSLELTDENAATAMHGTEGIIGVQLTGNTSLLVEGGRLLIDEPESFYIYTQSGGQTIIIGTHTEQDPDDPDYDVITTIFKYSGTNPPPRKSSEASGIPQPSAKSGSTTTVNALPARLRMTFVTQRRVSRIVPPPPVTPEDPEEKEIPRDPYEPPPPEPPPPEVWPSAPDPVPPEHGWRSDVGYFITLADVKYYEEEPRIMDQMIYSFDYEDEPLGYLRLGPGDSWTSEEIIGQVIRGLDVGCYGLHRLSYLNNGDFSL